MGTLALGIGFAGSIAAEPEADPADEADVDAPAAVASDASEADQSVHQGGTIDVRGDREKGEVGPVFEPSPEEVQVIREEEIRQTPASSVDEVVKNYPGFRVQQRIQGERAAVSIEGLPPEYTQILVNGQRYTGQLDAVDDLSDLPLTNVDRIELLRGAQAVRYGSDAAGGVVNVLTREPPEEGWRADLNAGYGEDQKIIGAGTLATRVGDLGVSVSATHDEIAGYDRRDVEEGIWVSIGDSGSRFATEDFYATLEHPVGENADAWVRGGYRMEGNEYEREGSNIGSLDFERGLASLGLDWQVAPAADIRNEISYFRGDTANDFARRFDLGENLVRGNGSGAVYFDLEHLSQQFILGYDVRYSTLDLDEGELDFEPTGGAPPISSDRRVSKDLTNGSIYLRSESSFFSERVVLAVAGRGQYSSRFDTKYLAQVALLVSPFESLRLRFQWGTAYRTPSLRELFQPDAPQLSYFLGGNPDLRPEESQSFRLGFEWNPTSWFSMSSVAYHNEIDDLIRTFAGGAIQTGVNVFPTRPDLRVCELEPTLPVCQPILISSPVTADVNRPQNIDEVRIRGIQSQFLLQPHPRLALRAGYTYQETETRSELLPDLDEIPNEPEHVVNLAGALELPSPGWIFGEPRISGAANFRGAALVERSGTGLGVFASTFTSDPSWVVDARVALPILRGIELYMDVRNVTDEVIVDSYEIRGRTFFGGITFSQTWGDS